MQSAGSIEGERGIPGVRRAERFVELAAIVVAIVAVYARFVGLGAPPFGGDERYIVLHALKFGTGDLNPHFFDWPASPLMYGTFGAYGFYYATGRLAGWFHSSDAFGLAALFTPDAFYFVPRLMSALCGTATAVVVWKAATRVTTRAGGALAAAAVLAAPIHVEFSRLGLADVPMTAAVAVVMVLALGLASEPDGRRSWIAAGMVGLATSLKYQGALVAGPLAVGVVLGYIERPDWLRAAAGRLGLMALVAVSTFAVLTPFAVLDPRGFLSDLTFQFAHQNGIEVHYGVTYPAHPVRTLLFDILPAGFGMPLLIGAAAGTFLQVRLKANRSLSILMAGVLLYGLAMLGSAIMAQHYAMPMLPFLAVLAAALCSQPGPLPRIRLAVAVGLVASLLLPLEPKVRIAAEARLPTTEQAVVDWVMQHTAPGSPIAMEDSLPIAPTTAAADREIAEARAAGLPRRADYWVGVRRLVNDVDPQTRQRQRDTWVLYDADNPVGYVSQLERAGVCTVVRFDRNVSRFTRSAQLPGARERLDYYRELDARGRVVAAFSGEGLRGPGFSVYRLRECAERRP